MSLSGTYKNFILTFLKNVYRRSEVHSLMFKKHYLDVLFERLWKVKKALFDVLIDVHYRIFPNVI